MSDGQGGGVRFRVRVAPRSGEGRLDGVIDGQLRARVAAPPVDGAANEALLQLLRRELGRSRRAVRIVAGETARTKVVEVDGIEPADLLQRWPGLDLGGRRAR